MAFIFFKKIILVQIFLTELLQILCFACYDMSTLQTSGEFHAGVNPGVLKLPDVFTKSLCFICGPCEEKCEATLLRNDHETIRKAET